MAKEFSGSKGVRDAFGWSNTDCGPGATLPLGCIVATCTLTDCVKTESIMERIGQKFLNPYGSWDITEQELSFGNYDPDRWAWLLIDIKWMKETVPVKGALGLWNWNKELLT